MGDMAEILEELGGLTQQIQQAKEDKAKKSGQLSEQMKILKTLGVKSTDEGSKTLKKHRAKITQLEKAISKKMAALKEEYEW
jgi:predicted  nucleic acid-binding Zn-ribbon protein